MKSHRPFCNRLGFSLLSVAFLAAGATGADAASTLGGPLVLEDEGSFFVNGVTKDTVYVERAAPSATPEQITIRQMYVHYWIPAKKHRMPPVIMVHGPSNTGAQYETTPDGREGWATYFVRHRIPVYVVDHAGRGRSGFDNSVINEAKLTMNFSLLQGIGRESNTRRWTSLNRFGPSFGVPYTAADGPWFADTLFPVEAAADYFEQLVPSGENTFQQDIVFNVGLRYTPPALVTLLEDIGPAIVLGHSQGSLFGIELARLLAERGLTELLKGLIFIEGLGAVPPATSSVLLDFPFIVVDGDYRGAVNQAAIGVVNAVNQAGGDATYVHLPAIGIHGNSNILMMDKNNLEVADLLLDWMLQHVPPNQ